MASLLVNSTWVYYLNKTINRKLATPLSQLASGHLHV